MPRQGLLRNAGEDTIHANQIVPETAAEKRKNWWYYHRAPLLLAAVAVLIVASILYSVFSKVKPDYTVAVLTSYTMPQNGASELARCLEAYGVDRNGDGRVVVDVAAYTFSGTEPTTPQMLDQENAALSRLAVDTGSNDSMIFFVDDNAFSVLQTNFGGFFQYNDGTPMPEDAVDYENVRRPWSDFAALAGFVPITKTDEAFDSASLLQLYGRLSLSVRTSEGFFEDNEKDLAYYRDSLELYERLLTGELPE